VHIRIIVNAIIPDPRVTFKVIIRFIFKKEECYKFMNRKEKESHNKNV